MKTALLLVLVCLSGCSWFHGRKPAAPDPPELLVTGAPAGSLLYVDGVPRHPVNEAGSGPQTLRVTPGTHVIEVRMGDDVAYREDLDVFAGERRVVAVLSGNRR